MTMQLNTLQSAQMLHSNDVEAGKSVAHTHNHANTNSGKNMKQIEKARAV